MRFRLRRSISVLILGVFFVLTLKPSQALSLSVEEQKRLGEELFLKLKSEVRFVDDPLINLYVRGIGRKIVEVSGDRRFVYRFYVIEGSQPNAFTIPGGYVFVNTALLNLVNSEDELAGVLAHEISHSVLDHVSRMFDQAKRISLGTLAAFVAALLLTKDIKAQQTLMIGASALGESLLLKYSRDNEFEADQLGFDLLCKAGWNPYGFVSFMRKMDRWSKNVSIESPTYLSTHPAITERIAYLESRCERKTLTESPSFKRIKSRLKLLERRPEKEECKMDPYFCALSLVRKGEKEKALEIVDNLLKESPDDPYLLREKALILISLNRFKEGETELREALKAFPGDRELLIGMVNRLSEEGKVFEAIALLEQSIQKVPEEPYFHQLLGELLLKAKREGEAYEQFGLYFLQVGDKKSALRHFQKALELSEGERKERLEKRIKELESS